MHRHERQTRKLAFGYAALAGAVDAAGFLKSGGLFVSFMTGNSTRLAVGIAQNSRFALAAATLVALFVAGVVLTVLVSERVRSFPRKVAASVLVAALLIMAAAAGSAGAPRASVGCLCLAMGGANAIFRRDGDVSIGVTYMTGTLVRLGHRLADRIRGVGGNDWPPYLLLWLSLVFGGVGGALTYLWSPELALWSIALFAVALAAVARSVASK